VTTSRDRVLVYVGLNRGETFARLVPHFSRAIGFEPIPALAAELAERYADQPTVEIVNAAVAEREGLASFFVTAMGDDAGNMQSSSLCEVSDAYRETGPRNPVHTQDIITVRCVNLDRFLTARGIRHIDLYVSDAEGYDFTIFSTIRHWFDQGRIALAQFETEADYVDVVQRVGQPPNKSRLFVEALRPRYDLVAMQDGDYDPASPTRWFNRDLTFRLRGDR
jgi:FkbM family methyltransferase